MGSLLVEGFLFGLASAPFCAAICVPVILPVLLIRGEKGLGRSFLALGEFLLGRLITYVLFGVLLGLLGAQLPAGLPVSVRAVAYAAIGLAMLLAAAGLVPGTRDSRFCSIMAAASRSASFPVLLGALTGISLCPPFLAAITETITASSWAGGGLYFFGFFVGTSLLTVPAAFVGAMSFMRVVRSLGTVACAAIGMILLTSAAFAVVGVRVQERPPAAEAQWREVLPGATEFVARQGDPPHLVGFQTTLQGRRLVGYVFVTSEVVPEAAQGFGGLVPVLVGMDSDARIVAVKVLKNDETPEFVRRIYARPFLQQFEGKKYEDIQMDRGVDAVTGATVTASAVINGVREGAREVALAEMGVGAAEERQAGRALAGIHRPVNYVIVLLWAAAVVGYVLRRRWLRYVTLAASVVLLGFLGWSFLSVKHFVDFFSLALPPVAQQLSWYLLLALAAGAALFVGRVYCGWICPFGALTELLGRLSPMRLRISPEVDLRMRRAKYAVLVAAPILFVVAGRIEALSFEPFSDVLTLSFLRPGLPAVRITWLLFLAAASLVCVRFYCKYLCPVGAGLGFVAAQRFLRRPGEGECANCANCGVACAAAPEGMAPARLPGSECLACGECARCPRRAAGQEAASHEEK